MTEAVRYREPVWQVIGKVVGIYFAAQSSAGEPILMYLLECGLTESIGRTFKTEKWTKSARTLVYTRLFLFALL